MKREEVVRRIARFDAVDFSGPVTEEAIDRASAQLDAVFPPQYREFLSSFGCGGVDSEEFVGLGGPEHLDIVTLTARLRDRQRPLPQHLLPLHGDGYGNYDCLDLLQPSAAGEYVIVHWLHDGGENQSPAVLADSFDEWFDSILLLISTY